MFKCAARRQISDSRAVLPIPASPEIRTTPLAPRRRVRRTTTSALVNASSRPRSGPNDLIQTSVTGPASAKRSSSASPMHDQAPADDRLGVAGVDVLATLRTHDTDVDPVSTRL